jgi:hypothetical protein
VRPNPRTPKEVVKRMEGALVVVLPSAGRDDREAEGT